jgi:SMI1 / KNR4 family (SUKH-1)
MNFEEINALIFKFDSLGIEKQTNGAILIGEAPHLGNKAWLNVIYPKLTLEEIFEIENEIKSDIPLQFKDFLMNYSNGVNILCSTFSLYGLRKDNNREIEASRQPYSLSTPNTFERPNNSKSSFFFIGGYNWDGSHIYIDKKTNIIHCCKRWDAKSLMEWDSFNEMLFCELKRIYTLFDNKGKELDENNSKLPY